MALTPQKALEKIAEEDKKIVARLEKAIDKTIKEEYQGAGHQVIFNFEQGVPTRVVAEIKRLYHQAGWNVKADYEQREGAWLTLTERGAREYER